MSVVVPGGASTGYTTRLLELSATKLGATAELSVVGNIESALLRAAAALPFCGDLLGGEESGFSFEGATVRRVDAALPRRADRADFLPGLLLLFDAFIVHEQACWKAWRRPGPCPAPREPVLFVSQFFFAIHRAALSLPTGTGTGTGRS